jgi:hypothetical protein
MVSTLKSLLAAALGAAVNLNAKRLPVQVTGDLNLADPTPSQLGKLSFYH